MILADKWSISSLKEKCEVFLSQQLSQDTFKDIAPITKHVESPMLEKAIIEFVIKNAKTTKKTGSLTGLLQELYVKIIANILKIDLKPWYENLLENIYLLMGWILLYWNF